MGIYRANTGPFIMMLICYQLSAVIQLNMRIPLSRSTASVMKIPLPNTICTLLRIEVFRNRYFGYLPLNTSLCLNCELVHIVHMVREPTFTSLLRRGQIVFSTVLFQNCMQLGDTNRSLKFCKVVNFAQASFLLYSRFVDGINANSTPCEILLNNITHTVNVNSLYIQIA